MFMSFFSSKNQKLVKRWVAEHEQIVILAHEVIAQYSQNNYEAAKTELRKLNELAVKHIMDEDLEFYRLLKDQKRLNGETEKLVNDFTRTFKNTKNTLMGFLTKYTQDDAVLDDNFFTTFNELVGVLAQRIAFEEENLYVALNSK